MEEEKSPMQYSKCSDRITEKVERKEMCILKVTDQVVVQLKPPKGDEQDIEQLRAEVTSICINNK